MLNLNNVYVFLELKFYRANGIKKQPLHFYNSSPHYEMETVDIKELLDCF